MTKKTFLHGALSALTISLIGGCALDATEPLEVDETDAIGESTDAFSKHDECNQEYVPPPSPEGCMVEIRMEEAKVTSGQGVTEGKLELNVVGRTTHGGSTAWPSATGTRKVKNGYRKTIDRMVDVIKLKDGEVRTVQVCADVTEVDNGGINGDTDTGRGCKTIQVSCDLPPQYFGVNADLCKGGLSSSGSCGTSYNGSVGVTFSAKREDADNDGVSNEEDFTPDPCDEENLGQRGRAVLIYFHMGDGRINTLAQNVGANIDKAMKDYEYVVVLKEDNDVAGITLSPAAKNKANLFLQPTPDNLHYGIKDIVSKGYDLDVFIWSHGDPDSSGSYFVAKTSPTNDDLVAIDNDWIETEFHPDVTGADTVPIRMVYSVSCYHEGLSSAWHNIGALASSGAPRINFYPNHYGTFVDAWNKGNISYGTAIANEVTTGAQLASEAFLVVQGNTAMADPTLGKRPVACVPPVSLFNAVTGNNVCAEWYFENGTDDAAGGYDFDGTYDDSQSGAWNMRDASLKVATGVTSVTKFGAITY